MMKIAQSFWRGHQIPGLSVMDRYIISELILPFLFGMGLFTALGLSIGSLFDLVRRVTESGLPLNIALQVLLLNLPGFVVLAFPMATLLASLMAYGRLTSDSESIALRSLGVNVYRLVVPAILLSLAITGLAFFMNDSIAPAANRQASMTLKTALNEKQPILKQSNIIQPEYKKIELPNGSERSVLTRLFYAEQLDGEQLSGLTILDRTQAGLSQVITAQSATWNFQKNTWDFFDGTIYAVSPDGSYRNIVRFKHHQLALPRTALDLAKDFNNEEMSLAQTKEHLEIVKLSGNQERVRKWEVRIQEKIAIPFACVSFGLVGAALGLRPQNASKATSFGVCVGLIFVYYMLLVLMRSLGVQGVLAPFVAAWLPNFLGLAAGGVLLIRSSQ
jgi:lipopolysaccharide export system permease protein